MPENVNLNKPLGIIEVDSFGEVTKEDSMASLDKIKRLLEQAAAKSILVDVRRQAVNTSRAAANISKFAEMLPRGVKIAMVYAREHPNDSDITFLAASAIANSVNLRMFDDRTAAMNWLKN